MRLEQILENINARYQDAIRQGKPQDEKELTRDFLLSLPTLGLEYSEYRIALCAACGVKSPVMPWAALQREIYERWLLDIGTEEKQDIKPLWGCWLNLESRELATVKPIDAFMESDNCVWVEDYRTLGEDISWKDIVKDA